MRHIEEIRLRRVLKVMSTLAALPGAMCSSQDPASMDRKESAKVVIRERAMEVVKGATPRLGWRGGGHRVFVPGGPLPCAERAPMTACSRHPERHFGRVSVRDPQSLALLGSSSFHGIDPHEIRLSEDRRHVALANYGSVTGRAGTT